MMTLNQAKIELKNITNSIEDYINLKYVADGSWGVNINLEILTIHMVRELWPELEFTVGRDDHIVSFEELQRFEDRACSKHEDDEYYDEYARQDKIKQSDILEMDRIVEDKNRKIQQYEECYPLIVRNLNYFIPGLVDEFETLIKYAVFQCKEDYKLSNQNKAITKKKTSRN